MKKSLKSLIELDSNIKLYIPSNSNGKEFDNSKYVDNALSYFSGIFGGSTSYEALGCWVSNTGKLIKERVIIVQSFCQEKQLKANIEPVIDYAEKLKKELNQEAISLEVNNKLYFV